MRRATGKRDLSGYRSKHRSGRRRKEPCGSGGEAPTGTEATGAAGAGAGNGDGTGNGTGNGTGGRGADKAAASTGAFGGAAGGRIPAMPVLESLAQSGDPVVRSALLVRVLGRTGNDPAVRREREAVRSSPVVRALLSERDAEGRIPLPPYAKWRGAHWVLVMLAECGYPPGDAALLPLREQVLDWLLGRAHRSRIRAIEGRVRRCASQEGNAIYALLALGIADERVDRLAGDLCRWQWPDGGWNCDVRPSARASSFMESLIPLRGLALHGRVAGDRRSRVAAERAAELFLTRAMFRRRRDGGVIDEEFLKLHYPCYWRYDILFGLKVMAEQGWVRDPRCEEALSVLESKQLADGGFAAEGKYYRATDAARSGRSLVDWGGTDRRRTNPYVTLDALFVLGEAGRLSRADLAART